jgi:hypothetical protein
VLAELEPYYHLLAVGGGLLVALLLLTWLGRGLERGRRQRAQSVVTLTPGHALHVVELAGRRLVVGTGPSGPPRLLLELPEPGMPMWAAPIGGDAPAWVADAARRGPEDWTAHGP